MGAILRQIALAVALAGALVGCRQKPAPRGTSGTGSPRPAAPAPPRSVTPGHSPGPIAPVSASPRPIATPIALVVTPAPTPSPVPMVPVASPIATPGPLFSTPAAPEPTSQPASQPAVPDELADFPLPTIGQFAAYSTTAAGPQGRLRQTIDAVGPGEMIVTEQTLVNNQPIGKGVSMRLPRAGRRWPLPGRTETQSVEYGREQIDLAGKKLDCVVVTTESRVGGSVRTERQWICPQVPVTHLVRLVVITDGREVFRQELVEFGEGKP